MPTPVLHDDPFDAFDDQDDEFVTDYKAKMDAAALDDDLTLDEPYEPMPATAAAVPSPAHDAFADEFSDDLPEVRPEMATQALHVNTAVPDPFSGEFDDDEDDLTLGAPVRPQALSQSPTAQSTLGLTAPATPPHAYTGEEDIGVISIPRIAIHFFPDNEISLQACDTAALDRRMARAQCLVKRGGMREAIDTYRHEPTPSLVIVESPAHGREMLDQLGQLAEVCDANTKVVVIGDHNDIALYRELIRQGVSDYIVGPIQPLQIIKVIGNLFNDPETPFVGRAIAFVGARGGAGSSSIAHNFAYNLSEQMAANTVIVDYDLPFGTAGLDFNQDPPQGIADALNEPDRLDSVLLDRMLTKCSERLSLFSSPAALDQDYTTDHEAYDEVTRKVRSAAPFIVMDLPHVWTPWLKANLIAADDVVIVATPDLASLRNAKNIIDLLKHSRPNDAAPKLVLNQMDMPGRPEIPVKDFTAALGLEPCCLIPFDAKLFGQASNNGQMIAECGPTSKVAESLNALTCAISGRMPEPKAKKSFLDTLFKK